ncbi:sigma-70 family RNA polymerase sigma factor [Chitinophagaceae bacterium 26-R-25]|nr:sigma-70 family RNA polymerase sigma factor [Chitinophagaceae bacterium 26-R-25]
MQKGENLTQEWCAFIGTRSNEAFYVLYSHYHDYFIQIAIQKGFSLEKAKDCVNDLFLYLFENRAKLTHIKHHHNYLVTSFLRKLFRKGHFRNSELLTTGEESMLDEAVNSANNLFYPDIDDEEKLSIALKPYIDKLSYSQAKMIYQKFYIGLSYEEIATENGISIKTAYNTILQAIKKLRGLIGEERTNAWKAGIFSFGGFFFW